MVNRPMVNHGTPWDHERLNIFPVPVVGSGPVGLGPGMGCGLEVWPSAPCCSTTAATRWELRAGEVTLFLPVFRSWEIASQRDSEGMEYQIEMGG